MRKLPFRPDREISQTYNSGVVIIYSVTDGAARGSLPSPVLTEKGQFRYETKRLGLRRYFDAKQNNIQAEKVIRVPRSGIAVTAQDAARTQDGVLYKIELVQDVLDVWPVSLDLTLSRLEQRPEDRADEEAGI